MTRGRVHLYGWLLAASLVALIIWFVIWIKLHNETRFREFRIREVSLSALSYQDVPYYVLSEAPDVSGELSWRMTVVLNLQSAPHYPWVKHGWKSQVNREWLTQSPIFVTNGDDVFATIVGLAGKGTAFDRELHVPIKSVPPSTVIFIEYKGGLIHWMEPRDVDLSESMSQTIGQLSFGNSKGFQDRMFVAFADGEVWAIDPMTPAPVLAMAATMQVSRAKSKDELLGRYRR
jgi:hypothetical protein